MDSSSHSPPCSKGGPTEQGSAAVSREHSHQDTRAHTYLNEVQHGTEGGTLPPPVSLGTVLVAVGGQGPQGAAEGLHVLVQKILLQREQRRVCEQKPRPCTLSTWGCPNPSSHGQSGFLLCLAPLNPFLAPIWGQTPL